MKTGNHTPLATLRRDLNSEYVALCRVMANNTATDRQAIGEIAREVLRMRQREWIWAGSTIVSLVSILALAYSIAI
jgi:hypothetical protein